MAKSKLVIIGGGYAGVNLAQATSPFMDVTVIDRKDFFEHVVANVRVVVDLPLADKTDILYKDIKNLGTFVQGTAAALDDKAVILEDGRTVPYDYVVIATGTSYHDPMGKPTGNSATERKIEMQALHEKVKTARNVLIVGGGPTGVEVAAEILVKYPSGKRVTLVTSSSQLLPGKSEKMAAKALTFLEKVGTKVILNEKVQKAQGDEYVTSGGTKLVADCVFWTIAGGPNTAWLKDSMPHIVNDKGQVKVDEYLRVDGLDNMFALGDVTSTPEWKQAYYAGESAKLLAKNLQALVKARAGGNKAAKLKPRAPNGGMEAQFVSLGPNAGVGHLGSMIMPSWAVKMMKSKDLFVSATRKNFLGKA